MDERKPLPTRAHLTFASDADQQRFAFWLDDHRAEMSEQWRQMAGPDWESRYRESIEWAARAARVAPPEVTFS